MQEADRKQITPIELAAAMMQFTMKSIENSWDTIKPVIAAYLKEPILSESKEDELLREIYIAALALEIYCIPHAFDADIARLVSLGMGEVMGSDNLSEHHLSESISQYYLPRLEAVNAAAPADLALALVEEAATILYDRTRASTQANRSGKQSVVGQVISLSCPARWEMADPVH